MAAKEGSLITIEASDVIQSEIKAIWKLMSEVNRWPEWNKAIPFARLEGVFVNEARSGGQAA